jgi:hypothetical protein
MAYRLTTGEEVAEQTITVAVLASRTRRVREAADT